MTTSTVTRDVINLTICTSFVLLISMLMRSVDSGKGKCPPGRFGRNCRLTCQCQDNTDCDDVTGSCPRGCREGWSGPSCQRENVVLGMPTDMKTSDWSKGARAVDGDLGTCVTSSSNRTGWWRVDMLASRPVFFMEIFFANQTARPGRIRVHVSDYVDTFWGKPCTRIPASHKRSKYSCDLPSEGRYFGLINKLGQITLCEVFVFVCTPYTFGVDCSQECSCTDPTELCNAITGTCVSGCMDGWSGSSCTKPCNGRYGRKCRHACGHCYGNQLCDHVTGICASGCAPGWTGVRCKQECDHGTYGVDCRHRCHHCLDNVTCLPQTGVCPWRCEPGWTGDRCDTECSPGRYGQSCEFPCGQCYEGSVCDRREGICPIGCEPGYEGLFCTKVCSSGLWGPNCRYSCGQCANYSCDRVTGHCDVMGCQHGWMGSRCDAKCPAGLYGRNCAHMCGHCLGQCDVILGRCPSDCKPGWQGSQCLDKCANDTFGPHCTTACGYCANGAPCHHVTGHCPQGCSQGYETPFCNTRRDELTNPLARPNLLTLLIGCMSVVVCSICGVMLCLVLRRRQDTAATSATSMVQKPDSPVRQTVV